MAHVFGDRHQLRTERRERNGEKEGERPYKWKFPL